VNLLVKEKEFWRYQDERYNDKNKQFDVPRSHDCYYAPDAHFILRGCQLL